MSMGIENVTLWGGPSEGSEATGGSPGCMRSSSPQLELREVHPSPGLGRTLSFLPSTSAEVCHFRRPIVCHL